MIQQTQFELAANYFRDLLTILTLVGSLEPLTAALLWAALAIAVLLLAYFRPAPSGRK